MGALAGGLFGPIGATAGYLIGSEFGIGADISHVPANSSLYFGPAATFALLQPGGGSAFSLSYTGEELADVLMSRYEKLSTVVTSNRPVEDWAALLGDVVVVTPLLDRLMHHGHLLKFEGKSWRLRESAARLAKQSADE